MFSATQVPGGSERPMTVTTVIDEKTGESSSYVKADPYPWLAFNQRSEVRVAYGYRHDFTRGALGEPTAVKRVGRLMYSHDFLQFKALNVGATVHVDTDGRAFAGVGMAYRW